MPVDGVVLDTNVFVAAAFNRTSSAARLIAMAGKGDLRLVWNGATHREAKVVLGRIPRIDGTRLLALFRPDGEYRGVVDIGFPAFAAIVDPSDRMFAALGWAAGSPVVSSDWHLLSVRDGLPVAILTPSEFLSSFPLPQERSPPHH